MPLVKVIRHGAVFWEAPKAPAGFLPALLPIPAAEEDRELAPDSKSRYKSDLLRDLAARRGRVQKNIWKCKHAIHSSRPHRGRKPLSYWETELQGIELDIAAEKYRLKGEEIKNEKANRK